MERRLYFLLPDVAHAKTVVAKLETNGIERKYTHVIAAKGIDLEGLPLASPNHRMDLGARSVSYTHLTLPTKIKWCWSRWWGCG